MPYYNIVAIIQPSLKQEQSVKYYYKKTADYSAVFGNN